MGTTSKVCHVILRVWELICSVVVLGLVAHFVQILNDAGVSNDSRIVYTLVVASISTLYTIVFMPPLHYAFLAFPADFCLFVLWMVAFGLLVNVSLNTHSHIHVSHTNNFHLANWRRHLRFVLVLELLGLLLGRLVDISLQCLWSERHSLDRLFTMEDCSGLLFHRVDYLSPELHPCKFSQSHP